MARSTTTATAPASTAVGSIASPRPRLAESNPTEENPRRKRRGRKGRRHRNPKKNLGYGAKVGIALAGVAVLGGGGYLIYRHFTKPALLTTSTGALYGFGSQGAHT